MFYDVIFSGSLVYCILFRSVLVMEGNIKSFIIVWEVKYIFKDFIAVGMKILEGFYVGIIIIFKVYFLGWRVNVMEFVL